MAAKFPQEAPVVYGDKSVANDVGDALHWDGADANQVKAEVIAIATKVGVDGDTNEESLDYRVRALEARKKAASGSGTLANATATVVTDAAVETGSCVILQGTSAGFATAGAYVSAVAQGSFTLTHAQAAGTETFSYVVIS